MSPIKWRTGTVAKDLLHKGLVLPQDIHAPCRKHELPRDCVSVSVSGMCRQMPMITLTFKSKPKVYPTSIQGQTYETFRYYQVRVVVDKTQQTPDRLYMGAGYFGYEDFNTSLADLDSIIKSVVGLVRCAF